MQESRRVEGYELQEFCGTPFGFRVVPFEQAGNDADIFLHCHVWEQADLLDHVAHAAPHLDWIHRVRIASSDDDLAGRLLDETVDHFQGGGFPASGRAEENADLAGRDFETDPVSCGDRSEFLCKIFKSDHEMFSLTRAGPRA
jgi:hypothetical protein